METCYKAFRLDVIRSIEIEEDRFGFEPEITAKVAGAGWRVWEVSIGYAGRTYAEGKKITWREACAPGTRLLDTPACGAACAVVSIAFPTAKSRRRSSTTPTTSSPTCCIRSKGRRTTRSGSTAWSSRTSVDDVLEIGAGHGELTERLQRGRASPRPTSRRAPSTGCDAVRAQSPTSTFASSTSPPPPMAACTTRSSS